jgi:glycosyltransferase involved in cell wall biosynthesis
MTGLTFRLSSMTNETAPFPPPQSRTAPCPCGSGRRYKNCHGLLAETQAIAVVDKPQWLTRAEKGLAAQEKGELALAEQLYRESLAEHPSNPDALHMLGVVRTQRFDPVEGLQLIVQAADMVNWEIPSFRHNIGYTLSAFLSSRPPKSLSARIQRLHALRSERIKKNRPLSLETVGVLLIARDAQRYEQVLRSLAHQTRLPTEVAIIAKEHAVEKARDVAEHVLPQARVHAIASSPSMIADATLQVRQMTCDWVQIALDDVEYDPSRIERMQLGVINTGAHWGISLARQSNSSEHDTQAHSMISLLNGIGRMLPRQRVGDLFLDRMGLAISPSNYFVKRSLLLKILADPSLLEFDAIGLGFAALWLDEPAIVTESTFRVTLDTLNASYSHMLKPNVLRQIDVAVDRMLRDNSPPNPVALNAREDGVDFLKRSLRGGIGPKLSPVTLKRIVAMAENASEDEPLLDHGVEYVGFARAESGLGENLRALVRATQTTSIPVSVSDVDIDSGIRNADSSVTSLIDVARYRTRVICVNPDLLGEAFRDDGFSRAKHAYRVGFWFWELEKLPKTWIDAAQLVDEIWVATRFVADAVRRDVLDRPVHKVRTPVQKPTLSREYKRSEFGLREDACLFMFSFAYGSFATRKNPEAAVRAFRIAFPKGSEEVQLVIKSSQSELFPELKKRLHALANGDKRIVFLDTYLSRDAVYGLQSCCDAYVSLHRSEGLGLGLAECMAQAKPVIATNYSGNCEFMNSHNSLLVDYRLIPVREGEYPDWKNQVWADADVEHAATHMRRIFDDREFATRLGQQAATHMADFFSYDSIGEMIEARLNGIGNRYSS